MENTASVLVEEHYTFALMNHFARDESVFEGRFM